MGALIRDDHTSTSYPFWVIISPRQVMRCGDVHAYSDIVAGVWLSREAAQDHLDGHRYRYGDKAVVYTMSGWRSNDWRRVCAGETPAEILASRAEVSDV